MALFRVKRFKVPTHRPYNRYPLDALKNPGDGFIIKKQFLPKGSLYSIGRQRGYRVSVYSLPDGSKKIVLRDKLAKRSPLRSNKERRR